MLEALIALFVIGIVGVVLLGVFFAVLGALFALALGALGLAVKVGLVLGAGWLVVKLVRRMESPRRLSSSDRDWLDVPR